MPPQIRVDRASGTDRINYTFCCAECDRIESSPSPAIPDGWNLIQTPDTLQKLLRCPDCSATLERNEIARLQEKAEAAASAPAFDLFLEKQADGSFQIAMSPHAALMRWLPLGFFLFPKQARALADQLRIYAALAEKPGCVPADTKAGE